MDVWIHAKHKQHRLACLDTGYLDASMYIDNKYVYIYTHRVRDYTDIQMQLDILRHIWIICIIYIYKIIQIGYML